MRRSYLYKDLPIRCVWKTPIHPKVMTPDFSTHRFGGSHLRFDMYSYLSCLFLWDQTYLIPAKHWVVLRIGVTGFVGPRAIGYRYFFVIGLFWRVSPPHHLPARRKIPMLPCPYLSLPSVAYATFLGYPVVQRKWDAHFAMSRWCFKYSLFSPRCLVKWSNLTNIFQWVETTMCFGPSTNLVFGVLLGD